MSTLNNEATKSVALKAVLATEQRPEDKKFDIKVMDERNQVKTIDHDAESESIKSIDVDQEDDLEVSVNIVKQNEVEEDVIQDEVQQKDEGNKNALKES